MRIYELDGLDTKANHIISMKKLVAFFKSPLFFPVATLMILYTYWLIFIPSKTFSGNWDLRMGIICLIIYFMITVLGKILVNNQSLYILPYIIAIPISLAGMYYGTLYLFLMFIFDFYKERPVFIFLSGIILIAVLTYKKLVKHEKRQSFFFLTTFPIFALTIFNFVVYCPKVWAIEEFEGYKYYIVEEIWDYPHSDNNFYKCKLLGLQCNMLGGTDYGNPEIIIDKQKKEVSLADYRGLRYTDGSDPRRYDLAGAQLGNHIYYLSEKCNNFNYNGNNECESYTYIPYECNLENISCNPLPIKVNGDYAYYLYWGVDEAKKEINLLYNDDEILIFTYGEHPRCYVDSCEILQQK